VKETSAGGRTGSLMPDLSAKRTLVKSPPELWEELSEVERLAKHLGAFGEIKITKLEPEHTVAWEGEHASGTVSIEPSGWGTKVTLTAELPEEESAIDQTVAEEPAGAGLGAEQSGDAEPSGGGTAAEEAALGEPVVREPGLQGSTNGKAAAKEYVVEEPLVPQPVAEEPAVEEPAVEEPLVRQPVAEDPAVEDPAVEDPIVDERVVEEPFVEPPGPEPVAAEPASPRRRRRGFWAWLFRERRDTAARAPAPAMSAPSTPVSPAPPKPVAVEPPLLELPVPEPPVAEPPIPEPPEPLETRFDVAGRQKVGSVADSTGRAPEPEAAEPEPAEAEAEPEAVEPERAEPAEPEPVEAEPEAAAPASGIASDDARAALDSMLDSLGSAHHRPYSRG
jgi:hypothetical protein